MSKSKTRYEYKISLGKDYTGKTVRRSFYSTKSRADAKRKAEDFKLRYETEMCVTGESHIQKVKFSTWARSCLQLYKKPYVKPNTYSGTYLAPLETHLIPHFGEMYVDDIRPFHIQAYINEAAAKYSPETVKKDYHVLSLIFQTAVDNQLCAKNPLTKSIKLPRYETRVEKEAYTQEQYDTAYAFAKSHPEGLAIMLLLETGISRSELLGLRWDDLDVENRCIHINQGLVVYRSDDLDKHVMASDGLKNKFRQRTLPITDDELWWRLCEMPRVITAGDKTVSTEYIFHAPNGGPYQPNNWANRVYRPFMKDLREAHPDLPELSPHELRHTRATLWVAQGVDPYMVARLLGHSDLKMLTKIYDHTRVETLREALVKAKISTGDTPTANGL